MDIIGQKRGKLWAIAYNLVRNDKNYIIVYCECGKYNEITLSDFEDAKCECDKKEIKENKLEGKIFGKWKILERAENRKKMAYYKCICECGTEKEIAYSNLISGAAKSCGCLKGKKVNDIEEININELMQKGKGIFAKKFLDQVKAKGTSGFEAVEADATRLVDVPLVAPWHVKG